MTTLKKIHTALKYTEEQCRVRIAAAYNALHNLKCMFITFCAPVYCWNKTPSNIGSSSFSSTSSSCSPQNHFSLSMCVLFIVRDFVRYKFYFFSREKKNFFLILFHQRCCCRRCFSILISSIVWCAICEWGKIMNNEIKAENFLFPRSLSRWKLKNENYFCTYINFSSTFFIYSCSNVTQSGSNWD